MPQEAPSPRPPRSRSEQEKLKAERIEAGGLTSRDFHVAWRLSQQP